MKERVHKYIDEALTKKQQLKMEDEIESLTNQFWVDKGCPFGTVPIPVMKNNNLKLANFNHSLEERVKNLEFAGLIVDGKPGSFPYTGASAIINIYNPQFIYRPFNPVYSSASIIIESGNDPLNQLQVGWTVMPNHFGDYSTRMYIGWRVGGTVNDVCINFMCKGFIQVDDNIPLGIVLPEISKIGGEQFDLTFEVKKHVDGWEFYFGKNDPKLVGYLPGFMFYNEMRTSGERVKFGGQMYAPSDYDTTGQMGSGEYSEWAYDRACYMRNVKVRDIVGIMGNPEDRFVSVAESRCYFAGSNELNGAPFWGYRFLFGGAGGSVDDCH